MSDIQERLQRLLDGELDAAEVAEDPALASLADRLYGIKITPAQPKKLRDFDDRVASPSAPLPATDMMIEVIGDVALEHPPAPAADLPPIAPIPSVPVSKGKKSFGLLSYLSIIGLLAVVVNMFGYFHTLVGSMCTEACKNGFTKMNLLEIYRLDSEVGWSKPITEGVVGIPDIVAVVGLLAMTFLLRKKS